MNSRPRPCFRAVEQLERDPVLLPKHDDRPLELCRAHRENQTRLRSRGDERTSLVGEYLEVDAIDLSSDPDEPGKMPGTG